MKNPIIIVLPDSKISSEEITSYLSQVTQTQILSCSETDKPPIRNYQIRPGREVSSFDWNNHPIHYRINVLCFLVGRVSGLW